MVTRLVIEGSRIHDIESFYKEINRLFMADENWKIGVSLDAFNDLLYGEYGALKHAENIEIVWMDPEKSRHALGFTATKAYYLDKLKPGSPFNKPLFREKLDQLEKGSGETYFDTVMAILAEHPNITLIGH